MSNDITYDVRVWKTHTYDGAEVRTYTVRWRVGRQPFRQTFRQRAQADSFRSELVSAQRRGEAFNGTTGRPVSWQRAERDMSWYDFACAYADMKWKRASAKHRRDIARTLTSATHPLLTTHRGKPDDARIRRDLARWAFNSRDRENCPPAATEVLRWVAANTQPVSALASAATTRNVLDAMATRLDGKVAAGSTVQRHRAIFSNALDYAVELGLLAENPLGNLKWKAPKSSHEIDRRSVVNPTQARRLLEAVRVQEPSGPRLVAFFAVMYYAALRPAEAVNLRRHNITLPPQAWNAETECWEEPADNWGELHFGKTAPDAGKAWTDSGCTREERGLKHRAEGDTRTVPCPPDLTRELRAHLDQFGTGPGGRVFTGVRGGELPEKTYRRAWENARRQALTREEYASPLARRPYDLRHACVSTWLNGGVPPTQVAEWAGHGVNVLLQVYAKCIVGQDRAAKQRIEAALRQT